MRLVFYVTECLKYCVRLSPSSDYGVIMKEKEFRIYIWVSPAEYLLVHLRSPQVGSTLILSMFGKGFSTHLLF